MAAKTGIQTTGKSGPCDQGRNFIECDLIVEYVSYRMCELFSSNMEIEKCWDILLQELICQKITKKTVSKKLELLLSMATICGMIETGKNKEVTPDTVESVASLVEFITSHVNIDDIHIHNISEIMSSWLVLSYMEADNVDKAKELLEENINEAKEMFQSRHVEYAVENNDLSKLPDTLKIEAFIREITNFVKNMLAYLGKPLLSCIVQKMNDATQEPLRASQGDLIKLYQDMINERNSTENKTVEARQEMPCQEPSTEQKSIEMESSPRSVSNGSPSKPHEEKSSTPNSVDTTSMPLLEEEESSTIPLVYSSPTKKRICQKEPIVFHNTPGKSKHMYSPKRRNLQEDDEASPKRGYDHEAFRRHSTPSKSPIGRKRTAERLSPTSSSKAKNRELSESSSSPKAQPVIAIDHAAEDLLDPKPGPSGLQEHMTQRGSTSDYTQLHLRQGTKQRQAMSTADQQDSVTSTQGPDICASQSRNQGDSPKDNAGGQRSHADENQRGTVRKILQGDDDEVSLVWSSDEEVSDSDYVTSVRMPRGKVKKRRPWTHQEESNLSRGVDRFGAGRWSKILAAYDFNDRTTVDLKDKWRNMNKWNIGLQQHQRIRFCEILFNSDHDIPAAFTSALTLLRQVCLIDPLSTFLVGSSEGNVW